MNEKRITPEEVAEAYRVTGLKPVRGTWLDGDKCCGIVAMCAASLGTKIGATLWAPRVYGDDYYYGFLGGFDGVGAPGTHQRHKQGFEDGTAAAKAVGL